MREKEGEMVMEKRNPRLSIDLNSEPKETAMQPHYVAGDPLAVVKKYHGVLPIVQGDAATLPRPSDSRCSVCSTNDGVSDFIVCDSCQQTFHLACVRLRANKLPSDLHHWLCPNCSRKPSILWPLGPLSTDFRASFRALQSPNVAAAAHTAPTPNVAAAAHTAPTPNVAAAQTAPSTRAIADATPAAPPAADVAHTPPSNMNKTVQPLGKDSDSLKVQESSNLENVVNGFASDGDLKTDQSNHKTKESDEKHFSSPSFLKEQQQDRENMEAKTSKTPEDEYIDRLREFIAQKNGVLVKGWKAELRRRQNGHDTDVIYISPEGYKLRSRLEVARHLGLIDSDNSASNRKGSSTPSLPMKRKELARRKCIDNTLSKVQSCIENDASSGGSSSGSDADEHNSDVGVETRQRKVKRKRKLQEQTLGDDLPPEMENSKEQLPIQFEDFFIETLGLVDDRPGYHDNFHIWPVGYRSFWHDRYTGSLFISEVISGGKCGPLFRVKRHSCSGFVSPAESTHLSLSTCRCKENNNKEPSSFHLLDNEDEEIQTLLSDPSESMLAYFSTNLQTVQDNGVHPNRNSSSTMTEPVIIDVGEFSVESRSSSECWKLISRKFIECYKEISSQHCRVKFSCNHSDLLQASSEIPAKHKECIGPLGKLSSCVWAQSISNTINSDSDLLVLQQRLEQDRFGFDLPFVMEIIEELSGCNKCLHYIPLKSRNNCASFQMVGNGLLISEKKSSREPNEETLTHLIRETKKLKTVEQRCEPPPGHPFMSRLSPEIVGDVIQAWELLCRFHEIIGLKEPPNLEELEEEILEPWPDNSKDVEAYQKENSECREFNNLVTVVDDKKSCMGNSECDTPIHTENEVEDTDVEKSNMRETSQSRSTMTERCNGTLLAKIHIQLLRLLLTELQSKISTIIDPNVESVDAKKRGKKRDSEAPLPLKKPRYDIPPVNEATWPEIAHRYFLAITVLEKCGDLGEISSNDATKILRCIQGDGGILCGALDGVVGMEADAQLLAEAEKSILKSLPVEKDDGSTTEVEQKSDEKPEWAVVLEPVRKLPTNVGTRIRNCIYESLKLNPPEWVKEKLEWSISKEVYKGNASGPTKRAVLSILETIYSETYQKPKEIKKTPPQPAIKPEIIMKQCRVVLRRAAAVDEGKVFCNLRGVALHNPNDSNENGILGPPAMVSRPLDFRTIDLRLAAGAYGISHEAFLSDVRQVWSNIFKAYDNHSEFLQLADSLCKNFESLYEKEVLSLLKIKENDTVPIESSGNSIAGSTIELVELPKAPWEEGVCKVCGIDKDDDCVLLCDTCDSEYHMYCLDPPLAKIPEGNWYCPSCVAGQAESHRRYSNSQMNKENMYKRKLLSPQAQEFAESLQKLMNSLVAREYWQLSIHERVLLLKFLCEEALNTVIVHEHIDQGVDISNDLQQKLRSLNSEWKVLKSKETREVLQLAKQNSGCSYSIAHSMPSTGQVANTAVLQDCMRSESESRDEHNFKMVYDSGIPERSQCNLNHIHTEGKIGNPLFFQGKFPSVFTPQTSGEEPAHSAAKKGHVREDQTLDLMEGHASAIVQPNGRQSFSQALSMSSQANGVGKNSIDGCVMRLDDTVSKGQGSSISLPSSNNFSDSKLQIHTNEPPCESKATKGAIIDLNAAVSVTDTDISLSPVAEKSGHDNGVVDVLSLKASLAPQSGEAIKLHNSIIDTGNGILGNKSGPCYMESASSQIDLNSSMQQQVQVLEETILDLEAQLSKVSIRREFLGRDGCGRLYWALSKQCKHPWLVVEHAAFGNKSISIEDDDDINDDLQRLERGNINTNSYCNDKLFKGMSSISSMDVDRGISDVVKAQHNTFNCRSADDNTFTRWCSYETDREINELIGWLRETHPKEKELRSSISQWQMTRSQHLRNPLCVDIQAQPKQLKMVTKRGIFPRTKASLFLEKKFGPFLDTQNLEIPKRRGRKPKIQSEERISRCECLEPVWPSRSHCLSCHETFFTVPELQAHNDGKCLKHSEEPRDSSELPPKAKKRKGENHSQPGKCLDSIETFSNRKGDKSERLVKASNSKRKNGVGNPQFDYLEIAKKFNIPCSNKELVKGIGLISSKGIPLLVAAPSFVSTIDAAITCHSKESDVGVGVSNRGMSSSEVVSGTDKVCEQTTFGTPSLVHSSVPSGEIKPNELDAFSSNPASKVFVLPKGFIPESSLTPLNERCQLLLRRLKINLLDIDAALSDEIMDQSKASLQKRRAWRSFVKSAKTIFEMVEATIILEQMIRTDCLHNIWWYWSSYSAAVKVSTISALALRIYALDTAIIYPNSSNTLELTDPTKLNKNGKRRKDEDG